MERLAPPQTAGLCTLRVRKSFPEGICLPEAGPAPQTSGLQASRLLSYLAGIPDPLLSGSPSVWDQDSALWKSPQAQTTGIARGEEALT